MTSARIVLLLAILASAMDSREQAPPKQDPYALFERPTQIVAVGNGAKLALYCAGHGSPTVILETGAGGRTYEAWYKLQPILARHTRVCSYDRAGFGFSQLGTDLPRDLNHDIADLHDLLIAFKEKGPYVLVGHSMGGTLVGAYADKYPAEVSGLILLEPAIVLSAQEISKPDSAADLQERRLLERDLENCRRCESRMAAAPGMARPTPHDECLDSTYFDSLPPAMAAVELRHESNADYWRALESELENDWLGEDSRQAASLMPHRWRSIPARVVTAAVSTVNDAELAKALGVPVTDRASLESTRKNHARWEQRQARACEFCTDCSVTAIKTANHFVQNAAPEEVARIITEIAVHVREHPSK